MDDTTGLVYLLEVFRVNRINIKDAGITCGTEIEIFPTALS